MLGCRKSGTLTFSRHEWAVQAVLPLLRTEELEGKAVVCEVGIGGGNILCSAQSRLCAGPRLGSITACEGVHESPRGKLWSWVWSCGPEANDQHQSGQIIQWAHQALGHSHGRLLFQPLSRISSISQAGSISSEPVVFPGQWLGAS